MKVKLGDIYNITSGGTPSRSHSEYYKNGNIRWVKTGDLKEKYLYKVEDYISLEGLNNSSARMYKPDTVLIAMYGATIGAVSILKVDACTNQACAAFSKHDDVIPEYLYFYLKSRKERFVRDGVGGAQPNISVGYLKNVVIDLPALGKQTEIVDKLESVEKLIEYEKVQLLQYDVLIKSRFVEMFGDTVKNPMGWDIKNFNEISLLITDGEHVTPKRTSEGIFLLSARNVLNHVIQIEDVDFIDEAEYNRIAKRVVPMAGDILISCSGSIGRCCVVPKDFRFQMVRSVALIRFNKSINPIFAEWLISSDGLQRQIMSAATQSSQANLFQGKIQKLQGYVPPLQLQNEFAAFVRQVDKLKVEEQKNLEKAQFLSDSLMQQYFG